MHVRIDRKELEQGILTASKAVNSKSPLPILGHLLLRAEGDKIHFAATDLEMIIECSVPAHVDEPGTLTAPARIMADIITQLDGGEVRLETMGNQLCISTHASEFRINTLSADEFPVLPQSEANPSLVMPQMLFRDMIRAVLFAVAGPDETRAILTGVLTQVEDGQATLVATDGRRLARAQKKFDASVSASSYKAVIPARAMSELQRMLSDTQDPVEITPSAGQVFFRVGAITLVSRLLEEGRFPDCEAIIPKTSSRTIHVHRDQFLMALRRALIMAQEKDAPRLLKLEISAQSMSIRANTPDVGQACERLPVTLEGEEITIAFNGKYVIDAVTNLAAEEIVMRLNDPLSMGVLQPVGADDYLCLVMPVRIKETVGI